MIDEKQFDAIVAGFYKAATGEIAWGDALTPIHQAFKTRQTLLNMTDVSTGKLLQLLHSRQPAVDTGVLDYIRHWHQFDPRRDMIVKQPQLVLKKWWHCFDHFDERFVDEDKFYQHFLIAQETRYMSMTAAMMSESTIVLFAVELPSIRGPLRTEELHVLDRLSRHVFDALRMHERVRRLAAQAVAGHGLLDSFIHPMWLLDGNGLVFYQNTAGSFLVSRGGVVEAGISGLRWRSTRLDRKFNEQLKSLCDGEHGARVVLDARVKTTDLPCWLHLHALSPLRVLGAFGDRPLVLATLFHPQHFKELDLMALGDLFGMTPTEAKVATFVAAGLDANEMATRLRTKESTIRTHLRNVFAKIGAKRMADAVRLLCQGDALWTQPGKSHA